MTVAKFSNDSDGKWIIGLVVLALLLAFGYLMNLSKTAGVETSSSRSDNGAPIAEH